LKIKQKSFAPKIQAAINNIDKAALRVGWGEKLAYEDGTPVAMIAAQNEFGNPSRHIPPRPFLRPAISDQGTEWKKKIASGMRMVFSDKMTVSGVFEAVGALVKGDIQKSIASVHTPALKTATVKARLRGKKQGKSVSLTIAKPLVDSGYMMASVMYEEVTK